MTPSDGARRATRCDRSRRARLSRGSVARARGNEECARSESESQPRRARGFANAKTRGVRWIVRARLGAVDRLG